MVLDLETILLVSIKGKVVEQAIDEVEECLKGLAKKYLGIEKYYYRRPNYINLPCFLFPCLHYMTRMITGISIRINQI